eukprot:TRINITY_DN35869_c0_g1_i1.p1 TRINITY_DN35869_c0_g1~~TRINITY_DN35869_c0_g1_i1.p1  ORF type:complete len:128 (-),score=22.97 TRINITY_DN35869_c0_g1_i1:66-449(-)
MTTENPPEEDFQWAVQTGDLPKVKEFVEKKNFDVNFVKKNSVAGNSPLHWAADFGKADVIEYLISKGAKVNQKDSNGITPLLNAVYESHTEAVKALLKHGADKSIKGPDDQTAFQAAEKQEIKNLLK